MKEIKVKNKIIDIKNIMNNLHINFELPITKTVHITKYRFLGFIEGKVLSR